MGNKRETSGNKQFAAGKQEVLEGSVNGFIVDNKRTSGKQKGQ